MKDIREADAGHATQRDLPYPGTTPEFERLIAELRAEVHALREMVQPLHDARVAEMKRQEAERERQRIAADAGAATARQAAPDLSVASDGDRGAEAGHPGLPPAASAARLIHARPDARVPG